MVSQSKKTLRESQKTSKSPKLGRFRLRNVLVLPFIIPIFLSTGLVGWLSFRSGQRSVNEIANQLRSETAIRVQEELHRFLEKGHLLHQINVQIFQQGLIDLDNSDAVEQYFWKQSQLFNDLGTIAYANNRGEFVGANGLENYVVLSNDTTERSLRRYAVDRTGQRGNLLAEKLGYDARTRYWYQTAETVGKPTWTKIDASAIGQRLEVSAVYPFYNPEDNILQGVLLCDLPLDGISQFLQKLKIGKTGQVFILERDGSLVSTSTKDLLFITDAKTQKPQRLLATQSTNHILQGTAQALTQNFGNLNRIEGAKQLEFFLQENRFFLQVQRFQDGRGIDWLILVVMPESDFMEAINANIQQTIFLCIATLLASTLFGILITRWITRPLLQVSQAAEEMATGKLEQQVTSSPILEIETLASSFNSMAKQLQESFATLEKQNQDLKHLDQLKDEFLANTSHELRTPLNGIIGIAESLIDGVTGKLSQATLSNLSLIASSGRRLSSLINDILDFSKLRHKKLELQLKPVDLRSMTEVAIALLKPLAVPKKLQLIDAIPPDLPPAEADENRLQQILYNLIGNAIKFTHSGSVEISAKVVETSLENPLSSNGNQQLAITISDSGIGIAQDKFERIFASFEQADGSTAREYGGTGLGLTVTKQLVELHGGRISVTSQVGVGSQFTFTLPISQNQAELTLPLNSLQEKEGMDTRYLELPAPTLDRPQVIPNPQNNLKVLIVDDEPINLQVLVNTLSLQDYHITQAIGGEEAIALLEQGFKPDLILLDVMMPKMTGYEVTQKIRERFPVNELPILLLTAKNQVQDIVTGLSVGANDYLAKPIAKDELLARIRTQVNMCHLRAENLRLSAELEVTRKLQQMILPNPEELEVIDTLEIAGFMESADEVGGDYYDVLQQNGIVKIAIGDVTGHGLESGVLMLMAQTAVRTLQQSNQTDPIQFLDILNRTLYANIQRINSDKNMTLAILDYRDGTLLLSGQHEEIIIVRAGGEVEQIDTMDLGFPLGLEEDISDAIASYRVHLNAGDVVVLYTDGIPEAIDSNKQLYGLERLVAIVRKNHQKSAFDIRQAVIEDVRSYIGSQKVFDDMTLVVMKQK